MQIDAITELLREAVTRFSKKAGPELIAVVFIVLGDLVFIYFVLPRVQFFQENVWTFYLIFALIQLMVFALCLRILFDKAISRISAQSDQEEPPSKQNPPQE
jgi:hypothetical protein